MRTKMLPLSTTSSSIGSPLKSCAVNPSLNPQTSTLWLWSCLKSSLQWCPLTTSLPFGPPSDKRSKTWSLSHPTPPSFLALSLALKVLAGYRPDLNNSHIEIFPRYLDLIEKGWSGSVSVRPSAQGTDPPRLITHLFESPLPPLQRYGK
jgi:hypothetical protein